MPELLVRDPYGAVQRVIELLRTSEAVRIGTCLVFMLALVLGGLTLWLALPLPILVYVGLGLLLEQNTRPAARQSAAPPSRARTPTRRQAAARNAATQHHEELRSLARQVDDEIVLHSLRSIQARVALILEAIAEDHKYEAAPSLEELLAKTVDYLKVYEKVVVRRGFTDAEPTEMLRRSFAALAGRFDRFWEEINRDVIVDLRTLREIIDFESELLPFDTDAAMAAGRAGASRPAQDESEQGRPTLQLLPPIEEAPVDQEIVKQAVAEAKSAAPNGHGGAIEALTPRELDVLCLVARGKTDQEIAEILFISPRTASTHVQNAKRKLGTRSRTEAALSAVRHGIIDPESCEATIGGVASAQAT